MSSSSGAFWTAFWSGLSGPAALYAAPPPYPIYIGTAAQAFAMAGEHLSNAAAAFGSDVERTAGRSTEG